jgi:hypothetical protein
MNATAAKRAAGEQKVLCTYECDEGVRQDARRAKKLIQHALECPHRDLLTCPNFRAALEDHLERPR